MRGASGHRTKIDAESHALKFERDKIDSKSMDPTSHIWFEH
jgi:hypothetical protein